MIEPRVPLYDRLPEIYRIKDQQQAEADGLPGPPLKHYLALVEALFGHLHADIEGLYHDLFVETAADWVIPYLGDLLGVKPLPAPEPTVSLALWALPYVGDPVGARPLPSLARARRADLADTIALRRRKGTLGAIERLVDDLTDWRVQGVELRERLVWQQHLSHQRPDAGGAAPLGAANRLSMPRGGNVNLRDPASLSLLGTALDPFARLPDLRPSADGPVRLARPNLPSLALFLWRLAVYQLPLIRPVFRGGGVHAPGGGDPDYAPAVARFDLNPRLAPESTAPSEPVRLFNWPPQPGDQTAPRLVPLDRAPAPIIPARLSDDSPLGDAEAYLTLDCYDPAVGPTEPQGDTRRGLVLHLPRQPLDTVQWHVRGASLCAWEDGLSPPLRWDVDGKRELVVDPVSGRLLFAVADDTERDALRDHLRVTLTYGAVGPLGAHPIMREPPPTTWGDEPVAQRDVRLEGAMPLSLQDALAALPAGQPVAVCIHDSATYDLDPTVLTTTPDLVLSHSLILRAEAGCRPIIRLHAPLRLRSADPADAAGLAVRLEGLYLTRGTDFPVDEPLIAAVAVDRLELLGCTLDPGGHQRLDGSPAGDTAPYQPSLRLDDDHGYAPGSTEAVAFDLIPQILLRNCISGAVLVDPDHRLLIAHSLIDAGGGVRAAPPGALAIGAATDAERAWGAALVFQGITVLGRGRVEQADGAGGIFVQPLQVLDTQVGCIRQSWLCGRDDRLPLAVGCLRGTHSDEPAALRFTSEQFGTPAYGQLALDCDTRIRGQGPLGDQMGACGFLGEAHQWRCLALRLREQMPVGIHPLLVPLT